MPKPPRKSCHSRNIYQHKLDFKQIAIDYPEFRAICKQDVTGRISIDFKDDASLRVLTKTLLKKDFDLDVNIPLNYLVPTMSLRMNYILWLEDILTATRPADDKSEIHGIDIGTGATCVYMLLGAKKNQWHMVGTDIDSEGVRIAQENITNNGFDQLLKVVLTKEEDPLFGFLSENDQQYDFCMCNPPFFSTLDELSARKARSANRPDPPNAQTGKSTELVTQGGESEFVGKIIKESAALKSRVRIYTTMIGKKKNLPPLISQLETEGAKSYCETEFFQGHTTRWGLAWTFSDLDLSQLGTDFRSKREKQPKKDKPMIYMISKSASLPTFEEFIIKLKKTFDDLEFVYKQTEVKEDYYSFDVKAFKTTWLHRRQKKRAEQRVQNNIEIPAAKQEADDTNEDNEGKNGKRPADEEGDSSESKKIKVDPSEPAILSFSIVLENTNAGEYQLTMVRMEGTGPRDLIHQVLQYFKNNIK